MEILKVTALKMLATSNTILPLGICFSENAKSAFQYVLLCIQFSSSLKRLDLQPLTYPLQKSNTLENIFKEISEYFKTPLCFCNYINNCCFKTLQNITLL